MPGGRDLLRVAVSAKRTGVSRYACRCAGRLRGYNALIGMRALRRRHVAIFRLCLYLTGIACLCRCFTPFVPFTPTGVGEQLVVVGVGLLRYVRAVIPVGILTNVAVRELISLCRRVVCNIRCAVEGMEAGVFRAIGIVDIAVDWPCRICSVAPVVIDITLGCLTDLRFGRCRFGCADRSFVVLGI